MYSQLQLDEVSESISRPSRLLLLSRVLFLLSGVGFLTWAVTSSNFRDVEGFPDGRICLPLAAGIACLVLAAGLKGKWCLSSFLLAIALVGQAISLQLIEAGHKIRYQHYKPIGRLLTETNPLLLLFLALQAAMVIAGVWQRRASLVRRLTSHWRLWHLAAIGAVFVVAGAAVQREFSHYVSDLLFAAIIQTVSLGNILLLAWSLPVAALQKLEAKAENWFAGDSDGEGGIDRFVVLAASWVVLVAASLSFFV